MPKTKRRKRPAKALVKRQHAVATPNPPASEDLLHTILPGFGAYATTRLISRIVWVIASKRVPRVAKHASAASTILTFVGVWLLGHRVRRLARYHDSLLVGSGVAALQTVMRTYLPRYGWIVSDVRQEDMQVKASRSPGIALPSMQPEQLEDEYSIFEEEVGASPGSMASGAPTMPETNPEEMSSDDFADMFTDNDDTY